MRQSTGTGKAASNPSWVADHAIWEQAKAEAPGAPWGAITNIYKRLGGRVFKKADWHKQFRESGSMKNIKVNKAGVASVVGNDSAKKCLCGRPATSTAWLPTPNVYAGLQQVTEKHHVCDYHAQKSRDRGFRVEPGLHAQVGAKLTGPISEKKHFNNVIGIFAEASRIFKMHSGKPIAKDVEGDGTFLFWPDAYLENGVREELIVMPYEAEGLAPSDYVLGAHPQFAKILDKYGYYWEWINPEAFMVEPSFGIESDIHAPVGGVIPGVPDGTGSRRGTAGCPFTIGADEPFSPRRWHRAMKYVEERYGKDIPDFEAKVKAAYPRIEGQADGRADQEITLIQEVAQALRAYQDGGKTVEFLAGELKRIGDKHGVAP